MMSTVVKPFEWKWLILALIPILLAPCASYLSSVKMESFSQMLDSHYEKSLKMATWLGVQVLFNSVLVLPLFLIGYVMLYKLRSLCRPDSRGVVALFYSYFLFSFFAYTIVMYAVLGINFVPPTPEKQELILLLGYVFTGIEAIMGVSLLYLILGKGIYTSLVGRVGFLWVTWCVWSTGIHSLLLSLAENNHLVLPVGLALNYLVVGLWVVVVNRFLWKQYSEVNQGDGTGVVEDAVDS